MLTQTNTETNWYFHPKLNVHNSILGFPKLNLNFFKTYSKISQINPSNVRLCLNWRNIKFRENTFDSLTDSCKGVKGKGGEGGIKFS